MGATKIKDNNVSDAFLRFWYAPFSFFFFPFVKYTQVDEGKNNVEKTFQENDAFIMDPSYVVQLLP